MRTVLPWQPAVLTVLLTAAPLAVRAAPPAAPSGTAAQASATSAKPAAPAAATKPATPAQTPAVKPATTPPAASAKPATATPAAAAKPVTVPSAASAKPATAPPATPAKPATAPPATKPTGSPTPASANPVTPAPAAPGLQKGATSAVGASAPASVDPAKDHLPLAQATFGIKGVGALFATIEIAVPGKPVVQALHCELFADKTPLTVANFVGLARGLRPWKDPKLGQWVKKPLYDGNLLHRTVPELLIQGGDPSCNTDAVCRGTGEPGYTIPDEIKPELRFDRPGRLAMANRGPATGGAQFFITERDAVWLNGSHTIFGQCDGAELVTELSHVESSSRDQPKVPLFIKRVTFIRKVK